MPGDSPTVRLAAPERRKLILEAARRVFIQSGLGGSRVREISAEAGINEALLYRHFSSKEEMFEAAIAEPLEEGVKQLIKLAADAEMYVGTGEPHRDWIAGIVTTLLEVMVDLAPLFGVVLFADPERGMAFYNGHMVPAMDAMTDAINATDELWEHSDFDARLITVSVLGTCLVLALDHRFGGSLLQDRDVTMKAFTDNLFDGLAPRGL
ncbi:MAG: hypothetical protein QOG62_2526 [Thermoleophilaceae bacterium]|jgi:AcrR family transcriptional regulator|nr:hypothetical protein [Thermoleophilaceae bacterium]